MRNQEDFITAQEADTRPMPVVSSAPPEPPVTYQRTPQPKKRMPVWLVVIISAIVTTVVVSVVAAIISANTLNVSDVVEENSFDGQSIEQTTSILKNAGLDESMYTVTINDPDEIGNNEYVVDTVIAVDDHVQITAVPTSSAVIQEMDLVGENWHTVKQELESYGYENRFDYVVHTDSGNVYRNENWTVYNVDTTGKIPSIHLTNHVRDSIEDVGNQVTDGIGEAWENLQNRE